MVIKTASIPDDCIFIIKLMEYFNRSIIFLTSVHSMKRSDQIVRLALYSVDRREVLASCQIADEYWNTIYRNHHNLPLIICISPKLEMYRMVTINRNMSKFIILTLERH